LTELKILSDEKITESEEKTLRILGDLISSLQNNSTINNFGLPISYIDPQVIAETGMASEVTAEEIENATVLLDYLDGLPIIDGLPFWERLDGEIMYFYRLFKSYRDMKEISGTRSISRIAEQANIKVSVINSLSNIYHWKSRAKAYDMYRDKAIEDTRRNNLVKMENKHFEFAEEMFDSVKDIVKELVTKLKSKVSTKNDYQFEIRRWIEFAIKLERLSLGLPSNKPLSTSDVNSVITNYTLNQSQVQDNRQINVEKPTTERLGKMQEVINVLKDSGILEEVLNSGNGNGNGKEKTKKIIDVTEETDA